MSSVLSEYTLAFKWNIYKCFDSSAIPYKIKIYSKTFLVLICMEIEINTHDWLTVCLLNTVEPVYNGPVLSGHPLLSSQFSKSRFFAHTNAVFVTCIRRLPLLSGRGHPVAVLCLSFFVIFTCIKRPVP